jgi:hypothetical protein
MFVIYYLFTTFIYLCKLGRTGTVLTTFMQKSIIKYYERLGWILIRIRKDYFRIC